MKKRDKKQLLPGLLVAIAISFLVFLYAPVDLYCSNISEFWFDFGILFRASLGLFVVSSIVLSLIYVCLWLIHPILYRIGLAGGFLGLLCTYIQGNFLIKNLPPLDGTTIEWKQYTVLRTEDFVLWGVGVFIVVLMFIFLKKGLVSQNGDVPERRIDFDAVDYCCQCGNYRWCPERKNAVSDWRR